MEDIFAAEGFEIVTAEISEVEQFAKDAIDLEQKPRSDF